MSGLLSSPTYPIVDSDDSGLVPNSPGGTVDFLRADGTWETPPAPEPSNPGGIFGSGRQGTATFDGSTTILGLIPSGNLYTLTADIMLSAMTVNNGVTVCTAGYRVLVSGTLTCNGTIHNNGQNASGQTAGGVTHGAAFFGTGTQGGNGGALSTGNGGTASTRIPSVEWTALSAIAGGDGQLSNGIAGGKGQGGSGGGAGISNNGGVGGALSSDVVTLGAAWPNALFRGVTDTSLTSKWSYGGGGGGGAGDGAPGGGGGGGGGICCVCARYITGTGSITANGGAGANGPSGGAGGGGGGGGGIALVFYGNRTGSLTITANGGTPGTGTAGGGGGTRTGGNGGAGGTGSVILVNTSGDGT